MLSLALVPAAPRTTPPVESCADRAAGTGVEISVWARLSLRDRLDPSWGRRASYVELVLEPFMEDDRRLDCAAPGLASGGVSFCSGCKFVGLSDGTTIDGVEPGMTGATIGTPTVSAGSPLE